MPKYQYVHREIAPGIATILVHHLVNSYHGISKYFLSHRESLTSQREVNDRVALINSWRKRGINAYKKLRFGVLGLIFPFCLNSANVLSDENLKHDLGEQIDQMENIIPVVERSKAIDIALPYFNRYPQFTEQLLGQAVLYFPVIEQILRKYNLPEDLKYIPFFESGFRVNAVSPVGARGLWQFMESTGRKYGLTINREIDERYDFIKSTEAAARFLRDLHEELGNWALVLLAYNGGPNRVKRLLKEYDTSDVQVIMARMPRESQNYLSKMIAAKLIFKSYPLYGITPKLPGPIDFYSINTTYITSVDLSKISQQYGIEYDVLRRANPHLKYRKVNNAKGSTINVQIPVFAVKEEQEQGFRMQTFYIRSEEQLEKLATMLGVNSRKIELANQFYNPVNLKDRLIKILVPAEQYMALDQAFGPPPAKVLQQNFHLIIQENLRSKVIPMTGKKESGFLTREIYYLRPSESLLDVASRLNIPLQQIKYLNPNLDLYETRRFYIPVVAKDQMTDVVGAL